ncbi:hypothetical protein SAMN04488055_1684 [Chitinophaga niabensis]|uniref:Outer membrane protein beta-barrel domain-containing protein n=2 Tax=Chitinophaga niabensis TaxID=536979 RepID=A0A1N6EKP8_9BACT|nr:hypothetical protein SAMN04488055_1684 [Chitinophaga niabensis]
MLTRFIMLVFLLFAFSNPGIAQDSILAKAGQVPQKYLSQVSSKSRQLEKQVDKRTAKALDRMIKQEKKLQRKLSKIDSLAAKNIFTRSIDSLGGLKARLKGKVPGKALNGQYFGYLDTLSNSLGFLKESKQLLGKGKEAQGKLAKSMESVKELQSKLQQAENIKKYINERKQLLKAQLGQYTALTKDLQKINKEAYYYAQQLKEYKEGFKDSKKAERKAMELLQKVPAYKDFISRNSQLASLFNLPSGGSADLAQSLEGLQTRAQVDQLLQQRIGSAGPDARQALTQQMEAARSQFDELKKNFPDLDNAGEMPDFKPKELKTKSLLQRLEFGTNVQFQRSTQFFPTTGDFAGQVGYKFSKNGILGLGASYKLGMGTGFNNIRFSHQGVGFRSFGDYKLKGTFFVNGGFEYNYNQPFADAAQLYKQNSWSRSALIGVSKKYKINNKLKGNMMLLYDFLANSQVPRQDPVKFRLGYNF